MKTKLRTLKLLIILCSTLVTTAAFGQIITWIGPEAALPGGANFGHTTNWIGGEAIETVCSFDGLVPGNLVVYSRDGRDGVGIAHPIGGNFSAGGASIDLTPAQTGSVSFICYTGVTASAAMRFNAYRVQNGAGQFVFGNNTPNRLVAILVPSASPHYWINESANPAVINPSLQINSAGGNAGHSIVFQGTGGFAITNNLRSDNGPDDPVPIIWESTGTTFWAEGFPGGNGLNNPTNRFNTLLGPVTINAGTLVITTPRLLPLNDINGNTVAHNGTLLKFALSGIGGSSDTIPRVISGTGAVMVVNGTITFTATNTYTGLTTVSNGTLLVNGQLGIGGVNVWGGTLGGTGIILGAVTTASGSTLAPGTSIGTLTISSNLTIGGNMVFEVNKSLAQSNDLVVVSGTLTNSGTGMLSVSNLGPFLRVGDKFTVFNKPLQNGAALTVTGAGANWANNLAVDGSISVVSLIPPPTLNFTNLGGTNLQFSWSGGFKLQSQTNNLDVGLGTNWSDYPGGGSNGITVPIDATNGIILFRLISTP